MVGHEYKRGDGKGVASNMLQRKVQNELLGGDESEIEV